MSRHSDENSVDAIDRLIDEELRGVVQREAPPWLSARVKFRLERLEERRRAGFSRRFGRASPWPQLAGVGALAATAILLFVLARPQPAPSPGGSVVNREAAAGGQTPPSPAAPGQAGIGPHAARPPSAPPADVAGTVSEQRAARADTAAPGRVTGPAGRRGPLVLARSSEEARRMGLARVPEPDRPTASAVYILLEGEPEGGEDPARAVSYGAPPTRPIEVAAVSAPDPLHIAPLEVNPIVVWEIAIEPIDVRPIVPEGPRASIAGAAGNEESRKR
ncbi:MAG: hypothetical protein ACE148_08305 [Vicinamibacterales bacterium]